MRRTAIIVSIFTGAVVLEAALAPDATTGQRALSMVAGLAVMALAWRARWPWACLVVVLAALLVDALLGGVLVALGFLPLLAVVVAVFSLGGREHGWRLWTGAAGAAATLTIANQLDPANDYSMTNDLVFFSVVVVGAPVLAARLLADRRHIAAALREQAARVAADRDRASVTARLEERARLDDALRDSIAQRVGEIALQSGGAERLSARDPVRAVASLGAIEETARAVLSDIRDVLGVLRHHDRPEPVVVLPDPDPPRSWSARIAAPWVDGVVALAMIVAVAVEVLQSSELRVPAGVAAAGIAILGGVVFLRRRAPLTVTAAVLALLCAGNALIAPLTTMVTPFILLLLMPFSVALHVRDGRVAASLALCVVGAIAVFQTAAWTSPSDDSLLLTVCVVVASWVAGLLVRRRDRTVAGLQRSVAQLAADRDARQRLATARERTRVAREVHDIMGHSLTAIVVQAEAAQRLWSVDAVQARAALRAVGEVSRASLTQLRETLAATGSVDVPAERRLADVGSLVEQASRADLRVALSIRGRSRRLPAPVEHTAFMLLQEALTNAARHAAPTSVEVVLEYGDDELSLAVVDDGPGPQRAGAGVIGAGQGLIGMRERVDACGGWLTAAPIAGGGFAVRTSLPVTGGT